MKLIFAIILSSCSMNKITFFDKVSNDFDRYSYFVSIQMNTTGAKEVFIIENDDLYNYLSQKLKINKEQYKKLLQDKLINNSTLDIENPSSNFIKVPNIINVENNAKKGVDEFLEIYFDNNKVIKDNILNDERTAIIQKLFEWEIASKIDDETGYLIIFR